MSRWPVVPLANVVRGVESGFACSKSKLVEDGLPHLRPFNIGASTELDLATVYRVPLDEAPAGKRRLRAGDILFNNTNSVDLVGKVALVTADLEAGFSNHLTRIVVDRDKAASEFVASVLDSHWRDGFFRARATQWISQAAINGAALSTVPVPLPPLTEQRRIVDLLNRAAGIRRLREAALAKARETIPALFLSMFGDPATNPMGWAETTLGALVAEFRYGTSTKCGDAPVQGTIPVLRIPNVIGDTVDWTDLKHGVLAEKDRAKLTMRAGDLLFVRTNGNPAFIGRSVVFGDDRVCAFASYLIRARFRADAAVVPHFVREALSAPSYRDHLLRAARTTAGNYNMSIEGLSALPLPLAPLDLQRTFVTRLADLRSIIAQQERALAIARDTERALMAQLLG